MKINLPMDGTEYRNPKIGEDPIEIGKRMRKPFSEALKSAGKNGATMVAKVNNQPIEYTVRHGDHLSKIGKAFHSDPLKIATDNVLINPNRIYPGQKLLICPSPAGKVQPKFKEEVVASWYGPEHHHKTTASGQPFDMDTNTLAHRTLPFGTRVRLTNPENGKTAEGVINDRGPSKRGRDVDVSYALANKLGFIQKGIARLEIEIM